MEYISDSDRGSRPAVRGLGSPESESESEAIEQKRRAEQSRAEQRALWASQFGRCVASLFSPPTRPDPTRPDQLSAGLGFSSPPSPPTFLRRLPPFPTTGHALCRTPASTDFLLNQIYPVSPPRCSTSASVSPPSRSLKGPRQAGGRAGGRTFCPEHCADTDALPWSTPRRRIRPLRRAPVAASGVELQDNVNGRALSVNACPEEARHGGGNESPSYAQPPSSVPAPSGQMLGEDSGAVPVTAYPEACLGSGNRNWPCSVPAPSSMVPAPTGAPESVQDYVGALPVATYPDLSHGSGDTLSSPPAPLTSCAPTPGLMLEGYANNGAVSVSTYLEAGHGSGGTSLSAPAPSLAVAVPAPGRVLEEYSGMVSFDLYNKVFHGSGHQSTSALAPSSAVAVPATALAPMLNGAVSFTAYPRVFNDSGNKSSSVLAPSSVVAVPAPALVPMFNGAVPFTAYPEVFHDNRNKSSSVRAPSSVVAVPSPALVPMLNGAVPFTAYPEVFHDNRNKSSWVQAPSSVVAVPSQVPAPGGMIEENNGVVSVTAYPQVGHGTGNSKSSSPSSVVALVSASGRRLEDYVKEWAARKAASGAPSHHCVLPFLTGAPKAAECRLCYKLIHPLEEIKCSVSRCEQAFHLSCVVEDTASFTAESFKCPQHGCMVCKQKMFFWRCGRCTVAAHTKCAPWPLIHLKNDQGSAICWRHPSNWLLQNENADLTNNIEEAFCRLPLPYVNEEFNIDSTIRDFSAIVCKPPSYTHIRRNVYLVKKKRADSSAETGCRNCRADSVCSDDCECRGLSMSCSKNCRCSDLCSNKPFRKDKKFKIVKSEGCGWGAVALEPLEKGDFIIEYVGEVINDATCEQRLWEMKRRGDKNFYMCEISKDCTIDATFKGNTSRFLNHSCDPNCKLEKWQVEGETRVGVFASCSIQVGEPLTYDYRFVHFGEKVKCNCGAKSCQGYLGIQLKNPTQGAQTAAAALENEGDCSPSRLKPETHLLPWTNCIEVPFNLRSKTKIDRLCWGRKRQRTSIIDPSPSSASGQLSVIEAAASVPKGFSAELA